MQGAILFWIMFRTERIRGAYLRAIQRLLQQAAKIFRLAKIDEAAKLSGTDRPRAEALFIEAQRKLIEAQAAHPYVSRGGVKLAAALDDDAHVRLADLARRKAQAQHARQRTAEEVVRNDPYVQSLIQQFGAKIVPGSIKPISIQPE